MFCCEKFLVLLFCIICVLSAGCTQPATLQSGNETIPLPSLPPDTIRTDETSPLQTLTGQNGMTLYYFKNDVPASRSSACTGECARTWPPFSVDTVVVSPPLNPDDFAEFTRSDAILQTTYRGWPLYYYTGDVRFGDRNGDGIDGLWYAANVTRP